MVEKRFANTKEVAKVLGLSEHFLREVVKDRDRPYRKRKYSAKSHARVPRCVHKRGARYCAWLPSLINAIRDEVEAA